MMNLIKSKYLYIIKVYFLALIIIILLPYLLNATIYYVKTNGNDSLSGTNWQNAWRTIQKAANTMIAGDITYISNGTYYESVVVANSGAPGSPITFQAYNSGTVTVDANYSSSSVFTLTNSKNYIRIIGLEIIHGTSYGIYIYCSSYSYISGCKFVQDSKGIYIAGSGSHSSHIIITNCYFTNNNDGVYFYNYNSYNRVEDSKFIRNVNGITFLCSGAWDSCHHNTIKNNYICRNTQRGVTTETTGRYHKFLNNTINSNHFEGIYFRDARYTTYSNNIIIGNGQEGIEIDNWDEHTSYFYRNIIAKNSYGIKINASSYHSCKFKYNTIYSNSTRGIFISSSHNTIISNNIYGNQNYGIHICHGDNNTIKSNILHHNKQSGIYMNGSAVGNKIIRNNIFSNNGYGIAIDSASADKNEILTNSIYGLNQYRGIYINQGDENTVMSNKIHHNQHYGIQISSSANSNNIIKNIIYSNADYGIFMTDSVYNNIFTNIIYGANQNRGINLSGSSGSHSVKVIGNFIYNNEETGIYFDWSDNSTIQHNRIYSNPIGIYYEDSTSEISLNTITNNNYGVVYASGSLTGFHKNNLSPNNCAFSNASGLSVKITNNWWGSTIASVIKSKTIGITSYDEFTPYRLFGEFDITPGADTETPDIITGVHSYITNCKVKIVWNMSDATDFARYSIYRFPIPGTTNLTRNDVITNIYNKNITNYIDTPPDSEIIWYYSVTALDNKFIYTNESWYSTQTVATLKTVITIVKSISNVTLQDNSAPVIPGATITYKITYSNNGCFSAHNVIIYDKISKHEVYFTQGGGTATGWIFECSTDESPNQSYSSADYTSILPSDKSKIRWIRWKKPTVTPDEDGLFLLYKSIIK